MTDDSKIIELDQNSPPESVVAEAARAVMDGELIVAPTETRYGLVCAADNAGAVERLFALKGRKSSAPSAIFVSGKAEIWRYLEATPAARKIARAFLPGPLTLVGPATELSRKTFGPEIVLDGRVGVRVSSSPFIRAVLEKVKRPLTATSANRSGERELSDISEIREALPGGIALYLDSGPLDGAASTVALTGVAPLMILREGAIPSAKIKRALAPMRFAEQGLRQH